MHTTMRFICLFIVTTIALAQGQFSASNRTAPTHLGSPDGPLAGSGIFGQFLIGAEANILNPIGPALSHNELGFVIGGPLTVPGSDIGSVVQIKFVVWDSVAWGMSWANVPIGVQGMTDVVTVQLGSNEFPFVLPTPVFTVPAIVPVPEPAEVLLSLLGIGVLILAGKRTNHRFLKLLDHKK